MKKLLFVFFVLAVVLGNAPVQAQLVSIIGDDEREIPLDPSGPVEGGPITRGIISLPANAYISNDAVSVDFNKEMPSVSVSIVNTSTGVTVHSETYFNPTLVTIDFSAKEPGEYYLEIVSGEIRLSGYFTF